MKEMNNSSVYENTPHPLGIDIGSTTVKIAILGEKKEILFSDYERHFADIQAALSNLIPCLLYTSRCV